MREKLKCNICPHECNKLRSNNELGFCKSENKIKIGLFSLHYYEEPCISGKNGSGTVFFSGCNLKCKFCQNYEISKYNKGKEVTVEELSNIFLVQQSKGANNINLVTPTIYSKKIKESIILAKSRGLTIPIIYNCGGYEKIDTLKDLEGYIDVYLPDFKYFDNNIAFKFSGIKNYFENASKAILEMYHQVGSPVLSKEGIIQKGLIIRHLILPNNVEDSKNILKWIKENIGTDVYLSIMAQYFPTNEAKNIPSLNRKITEEELAEVANYLEELGFENGYIQELGDHEEEYVPKFDID